MNVTLGTARFLLNPYLIAGVLALAFVLGPAAGMVSADVDGPNHGCVEHPVGSQEYNEECNAGPAAAAPATTPATTPAAPSAAALPDTGGVALLPLAGAALLSIGALTAVGASRVRRAHRSNNRGPRS